jgi:hypothetical protein
MSNVKYKSMEDHVSIETRPLNWTGLENPKVTVVVRRDMEEWKQRALQTEIACALFRWGAITQHHFKAEIKNYENDPS